MNKKYIINVYNKRIYTLQRMILKLLWHGNSYIMEILDLMLFVHVVVFVVIIRKSYNYNLYKGL